VSLINILLQAQNFAELPSLPVSFRGYFQTADGFFKGIILTSTSLVNTSGLVTLQVQVILVTRRSEEQRSVVQA
jgi:hypothetical protein